MRYLVTGGAGFIGSHLVEGLLSHGGTVRVLDNFSSGSYENIKDLPVQILEGDIQNINDVKKAVQGVDVVFHLADLCSMRCTEDELLAVNVTGTYNVLEASKEAGVRRVVAASSSLVDEDPDTQSGAGIRETSPYSSYGVSKSVAELYCQAYTNIFHLETVVLRYYNVFGPRQNPNSEYSLIFPRLLSEMAAGSRPQIIGDGSQKRDFTHVDNIVQANLLAAESACAAGKIIDIAEGRSHSELELMDTLKDILECDLTPTYMAKVPGEVIHSHASIDDARELLGYDPSVSFRDGMKRTVRWYNDAGTGAIREDAPREAVPTKESQNTMEFSIPVVNNVVHAASSEKVTMESPVAEAQAGRSAMQSAAPAESTPVTEPAPAVAAPASLPEASSRPPEEAGEDSANLIEFPLIRDFRLSHQRGLPLQIQRWMGTLSHTKSKFMNKMTGTDAG